MLEHVFAQGTPLVGQPNRQQLRGNVAIPGARPDGRTGDGANNLRTRSAELMRGGSDQRPIECAYVRRIGDTTRTGPDCRPTTENRGGPGSSPGLAISPRRRPAPGPGRRCAPGCTPTGGSAAPRPCVAPAGALTVQRRNDRGRLARGERPGRRPASVPPGRRRPRPSRSQPTPCRSSR